MGLDVLEVLDLSEELGTAFGLVVFGFFDRGGYESRACLIGFFHRQGRGI